MRRWLPLLASEVQEEIDTKTLTSLARVWNVIVHDDPVTLMSYVTRVFMKVFGYPEHKARGLMLEVHNTGRSVVWTGGREEAETYVHKLQGYHLLTSLEPVGE